jgi:hypothetical protein
MAQPSTIPVKTKPIAVAREATASSAGVKKDSTSELPMFDLNEVLNFVTKIHDQALEAAPMPDVAKGVGYKHATSTPFYRRMLAARRFGLLSESRAELTIRARNFLKPDTDDAKSVALQDAVMGIPAYAEEIERHIGKKLNVQFVAHAWEKAKPLTSECALICAKVFESSIRTAGYILPDGTVSRPSSSAMPKREPPPPAGSGSGVATPPNENETTAAALAAMSGAGTVATKPHTLPLDKAGKRVVVIHAPLDLNEKEIRRIQKWIEVALFVDWNESTEGTTPDASP